MCEYQHQTPNEEFFFCSNPKVTIKDQIVTQRLCDQCKRKNDCISKEGQRPVPDFSLPDWADQAKNLYRALKRKFKNPSPVPEEIHQERLKECLSCEWGEQEEDKLTRCHKCGCTGLKLWWAGESCPIGKWESFEI